MSFPPSLPTAPRYEWATLTPSHENGSEEAITSEPVGRCALRRGRTGRESKERSGN